MTVADDLLKNDGQKFLEMMEQLAERRMAREEEAARDVEDDSDSDDSEVVPSVPGQGDDADGEGEGEDGEEDDSEEEGSEEEDDEDEEEDDEEEEVRSVHPFSCPNPDIRTWAWECMRVC